MSTPELLLKTIESLKPFTPEARVDFLSIWSEYQAKRKEVITTAGEVENYLYFITDGVQRIVYQDDQSRESTVVFTYTPNFGGSVDSFFLQKPSSYSYEALSPSTFLRASFQSINECMQKHHCISEAIRLGITVALSGNLERIMELQCYSSEEKFRKLLKRSPHILTMVPHKYLASYLGIDPTNFSKLINSVRI